MVTKSNPVFAEAINEMTRLDRILCWMSGIYCVLACIWYERRQKR